MNLDEYASRIRATATGLTGPPMRRVMGTLGAAAVNDAERAVRRDLGGNLRFSNWQRGADLVMRYEHTAPGEIMLSPTPQSRGQWEVAESGRRAGTARGRTGRRGRRVSASRPLRTWSDALAVTARETPRRASEAIDEMLRKTIDG